jgi:hypothetical protein
MSEIEKNKGKEVWVNRRQIGTGGNVPLLQDHAKEDL